MELTPLSPVPLPSLLFGLGSVFAAATALALATPNPRLAVYRMVNHPSIHLMSTAPGPGRTCSAQLAPHWLSCRGNACSIDKTGVQREQLNPSALMSAHPRMIPLTRDGRPVGMKVYAIPPCSRAHWLGLRNGDLITRVNGMEVSTPNRLLQTYAQLRGANYFKVDLERSGRPVSYEYTLR